jgi:2'-5' RNA ligase
VRCVAVVAYPVLRELDREWIESVRTRHDPQAGLIAAHFTLMFPAEADPDRVIAHAFAVSGRSRVLPFSIRGAQAVREPDGGGAHVFLVPAEGREEIVTLHDRLYDGGLGGEWHDPRAFEPHITVAAHADFEPCRRLARELDREDRIVGGRIEGVEVLAVARDRVESLAVFKLSGS